MIAHDGRSQHCKKTAGRKKNSLSRDAMNCNKVFSRSHNAIKFAAKFYISRESKVTNAGREVHDKLNKGAPRWEEINSSRANTYLRSLFWNKTIIGSNLVYFIIISSDKSTNSIGSI